MKVLHIINSLNYGGAEKLLLDTIPLYISKGIETHVLLLDNQKTSFYKDLEQKHNVTIHTHTKKHSIYNPLHILRIRTYIKGYDIVHVHLFPSLYWTALATLFLKYKTKLLVTEHNTENRRRNSLLFTILDRYIYKRYDKIIAISDGVKDNLQKHLGNTYKNIEVIHNGIKTKEFKEAKPYSKNALGIPEKATIIIQVASFTAQKDQDTLLKAIALLPEHVHLLLVGDGPLKEEKTTTTSILKMNHRVHFLGHRTDIPELLKTADISVLSSNYEGFGLAIVEGMAAGNPSLGSDVSGLSQIIGNKEMTFQKGNHIQLKDRIKKLLDDKNYYTQIQEKNYKRALEYDISNMIQNYTKVYTSLVE